MSSLKIVYVNTPYTLHNFAIYNLMEFDDFKTCSVYYPHFIGKKKSWVWERRLIVQAYLASRREFCFIGLAEGD